MGREGLFSCLNVSFHQSESKWWQTGWRRSQFVFRSVAKIQRRNIPSHFLWHREHKQPGSEGSLADFSSSSCHSVCFCRYPNRDGGRLYFQVHTYIREHAAASAPLFLMLTWFLTWGEKLPPWRRVQPRLKGKSQVPCDAMATERPALSTVQVSDVDEGLQIPARAQLQPFRRGSVLFRHYLH